MALEEHTAMADDEIVSGKDWYGGTTIWVVRYEYADDGGGGFTTDFFKTPNRYTPPTGLQVAQAVNQKGQLTLIGIEKIELLHTVTPEEDYQYTARDFGESKHAVIFDAFTDATGPDGPEFEDMI
jgi:hypothetical protein